MSLQPTKTNLELGLKVKDYLIQKGVETPINSNQFNLDSTSKKVVDNKQKIDKIENNVKTILETLGLDLSDDSLQETPIRVAKMFVNEVFWGLDYNNFPKITTIENKMGYDEMIQENGIQVSSFCEHHLVTIDGKASVAYIPNKKVLGLSKMNRIVEFFSRRPQVQERLTEQIFHALCYILETSNVAVTVNAVHYCVKARGVEDHDSHTITTKVGGLFKHSSDTRKEYLHNIPK